MIDVGLVVGSVVVNLLCSFVVTLLALRYVRRAREVEARGEALASALRELRDEDLVLVVRPAWRVFARLAGGAPIETCVEDDDVPLAKLVERAAGGLQRAMIAPSPSPRSGQFYLRPQGGTPRERPRLEDVERRRRAQLADLDVWVAEQRDDGTRTDGQQQGATWTVDSP